MTKKANDISWYGFLRSLPRGQVAASILLGGIRVILSAAWPYLLYHFLKKNTAATAGVTTLLTLGIIAIFILSGFTYQRQAALNVRILHNFSLSLTQKLWQKINSLPWLAFHQKNRVYYFDMVMTDAWRMRQGLAALLESVMVNSLIVIALTCTIIIISVPMFILCAGGVLAISAVHFYSTKKLRPYIKNFQSAWRIQHAWVATAVDQFGLLKMGRAYAEMEEKNRDNTQHFLSQHEAMLLQQVKWRSINQACGNILRLVVFIVGIYWVQINYISLTSMLLVLLIVAIVQNNMSTMPAAMVSFLDGQEAAGTLGNFFAQPSEDDRLPPPAQNLLPISSIALQNVAFAYNSTNGVNNINLHLQKGNIYLWQGANGSGKSTTAHILMGLIEPQAGTLAINGTQATWQTLRQLRHRFAFVNQDAQMFTGTLQQNLLFGHEQPVQAWQGLFTSWLARLMPGGENPETRKVGERGEGLSGGEARRLALVREWLREADIIVMDEPLNHLDDYAISQVIQEVQQLKNETIIIIISHQPGFENIADEIIRF